MSVSNPASTRAATPHWKVWIILIVTAILAVLVVAHAPGVNGPWYWKWSWRRLAPVPLIPGMLTATIPFAVGQWIYSRRRTIGAALALIGLSTLLLQFVASACQPHPPEMSRAVAIVRNPYATSYYTDALILQYQKKLTIAEVLRDFPVLLPSLHLHARYKPPGPILFYLLLINLTGKGIVAARFAVVLVALAAALGPIVTFAMVRQYARSIDAGFCAASFVALAPSLILFLPQFDQVYFTMSALVLLVWGMALRSDNAGPAIWFGVLFAVAVFFSYVFFMLGVFLLGATIAAAVDRRAGRMRIARQVVIAGAVILLLYLALWLVTGFDPFATMRSIAARHTEDVTRLLRPWPLHIGFDFLDFALGSGWISFILAGFAIAEFAKRLFAPLPQARLILLTLAQIVIVGLAALLPGEAARLWLPMLPLLAGIVGIELSRWHPRQRCIFYGCVWLLMTLICQNMLFVFLSREYDTPQVELKGWSLVMPSAAPHARTSPSVG